MARWAQTHVEVRELHHVAGGGSFVLKVMVEDIHALERLIEAVSVFVTTQKTIVFSSPVVKDAWDLPDDAITSAQDVRDTP